ENLRQEWAGENSVLVNFRIAERAELEPPFRTYDARAPRLEPGDVLFVQPAVDDAQIGQGAGRVQRRRFDHRAQERRVAAVRRAGQSKAHERTRNSRQAARWARYWAT